MPLPARLRRLQRAIRRRKSPISGSCTTQVERQFPIDQPQRRYFVTAWDEVGKMHALRQADCGP